MKWKVRKRSLNRKKLKQNKSLEAKTSMRHAKYTNIWTQLPQDIPKNSIQWRRLSSLTT